MTAVADGQPVPLRLLGAAHWRAGSRRHEVPDNLPGYLLCYLAYCNAWVGRDALLGLLWPERRQEEAQRNLRANLHRVRALLADWGCAGALIAERTRVRLALATDVAAFRAALGRADWEAAAALPLEPLAATLSFRGFPALEEWARAEREALAQAWREATLKAALALEQRGEARRAAELLLKLAKNESASEDALQALLRVAAAAGRRDEALVAYERFARWMRDELGLQPMASTVALAENLRLGPRPAAPAPAPGANTVPRSVVQPPRLVGRDRELALVADPTRPLIAVAGEPGVGKTRLLEEALAAARWVACREGLEQVPFAPLVEYLQDFHDSLPDCGEYRRDLARLVPSLAAGELLPAADPALGKARLLEALARVLEHGGRPLVFDDVQWADAATAELIVFLAGRARVPLRLAYRSTEFTPALESLLSALESSGGLQRLTLAPLSLHEVRALLALLAGAAAGPPLFAGWLHARTGGNPFFALQTLRALFEAGRLRAHGDGWASDLDAVTIDYSELEVPSRVTELVQRRLRGLSETARRVLAVVALVGSGRDQERLAAALGLSQWAAAEALAQAESAGIVREGRFVHDLLREHLLASLPEPLRAALHAAVARHFAGALAPERIAAYWWAAGQVQPALAAVREAVEQDCTVGLQAAALALLDESEAQLGRLGVDDEAAHAHLRALRARVHLQLADLEQALACARAVLRSPAQPADRGVAWCTIAAVALQRGQLHECERALREAQLADPEADELPMEWAKLAHLQGRAHVAVQLLQARVERLRRQPPGRALIAALTSLGAAHDDQGDVACGVPLHQEAYRLARALGARYAQVDVANNLLWALSSLGRDEEGIAIAREALALGEYDGTPYLRNNLAYSLKRLGRLEEARDETEAVERCQDATLALIARARLVELYALLGDAPRSARMAERVLATLATTEVPLAHYCAATYLARHGTEAQLRAVLAHLRPASIDPWMRDDFIAALSARNVDPAPYLVDAPPAAALTVR